jgi:hypothetical protein
MENPALPHHVSEEFRLKLARDRGRRVMYGGNPYEDDLEPDGSIIPMRTARDERTFSAGAM